MNKPVITILVGMIGVSVSMADIHSVLKIIALIVPTAYTIWRWVKDARKKNES